jgi:uncharacterized tellurite resistance protein B-like protein
MEIESNQTIRINKISLAGGGIQYLKILNQNRPFKELSHNFINLFKKMLAEGQNVSITEYDNLDIFFSEDPKLEVAMGLVKNIEKFDQQRTKCELIRLLGINIENIGLWNENIKPNLTCEQCSNKNFDLSIINNFISQLKKYVDTKNRNDEFYGISDSLIIPSNFNTIFNGKLQKMGDFPLPSSLFFIGLEVVLEELIYKN